MLLASPDDHLRSSDYPEERGCRVERESGEQAPAEGLEEVIWARNGVKSVAVRDRTAAGVRGGTQRCQDQVADEIRDL